MLEPSSLISSVQCNILFKMLAWGRRIVDSISIPSTFSRILQSAVEIPYFFACQAGSNSWDLLRFINFRKPSFVIPDLSWSSVCPSFFCPILCSRVFVLSCFCILQCCSAVFQCSRWFPVPSHAFLSIFAFSWSLV